MLHATRHKITMEPDESSFGQHCDNHTMEDASRQPGGDSMCNLLNMPSYNLSSGTASNTSRLTKGRQLEAR